MFGSNNNNNNNENTAQGQQQSTSPTSPSSAAAPSSQGGASTTSNPPSTTASAADRKSRRISSNTVSNFMASAKQSLSHSSNEKADSKAVVISSPTSTAPNPTPDDADTTNNAAGNSQYTPRNTFRVGVSEDKNKRCRRTMEDTHAYLYNFLPSKPPFPKQPDLNKTGGSNCTIYSSLDENLTGESDNGYFAIFDGHAGSFAADWCGKNLHHLLEDTIRSNPQRPIPELLDLTFTNVDKELKDLPVKNSGCTAVCAILRWEEKLALHDGDTSPTKTVPTNQRVRMLYTANVGDARIVLCRAGKALRLSYDHKGSDENEGKRVSNAGGLILNNRVNGVLAVTRALGDSYIKDLVTGHPYTTETMIEPDLDEFLILACDGLWDVCSDQEAVDHVRTVQDAQDASRMLVEHALARFSTDNLSCMVVRLEKPKEYSHTTVQGAGLGLGGLVSHPEREEEKQAKAVEQQPEVNHTLPVETSNGSAPVEANIAGGSAVVDEDVVMGDASPTKKTEEAEER